MGTSQQAVYNKALRWLEERPVSGNEIANTVREPVRLLNAEWTDAVNFCLYQGFWNFAIRWVSATPDNGSPQFGYAFSYQKPPDWVHTYQMADNEGFEPLLRWYNDQNNVWYTNTPSLYIKYVSNDSNYGWNLGLWTPGFVEYVAGYLAWVCAPRIKQASQKIDEIEKRLKKLRAMAIATDAMDLPPGKIPYGTWVMSRAPRGSVLPGYDGWGGYD
jgi:hypothetical protein